MSAFLVTMRHLPTQEKWSFPLEAADATDARKWAFSWGHEPGLEGPVHCRVRQMTPDEERRWGGRINAGDPGELLRP